MTHNVPAKDFSSIGHKIQRQEDSQSPQTTNLSQNDLDAALSELGISVNDREVPDAADVSRQFGDIKAYAFYGRVAGWMWALIWLFFTTVFIFGLSFPCK